MANLWVSRLIGDAQSHAVGIAFTATATNLPKDLLRPSIFIGWVCLLTAKQTRLLEPSSG